MNIYQLKGYESRVDYLQCLAEDYGVSKETVYTLAEFFGSTEDFDGLISELDDIDPGSGI